MPSTVPAAEDTIGILRALAQAPGPLPAATLARQLGLPRSTTYHLLAVLRRHGFVVHLREERAYGLGIGVFELGTAYLRQEPLERLGRPVLTGLLRRIEHDPALPPAVVHLGVLHGRETLYLVRERSPDAPSPVTGVGVRLPAQLTATGRAMLAALPRPQVRALFPDSGSFVDRTGRGPLSTRELREVLAEDRGRGWSYEIGEVAEGLASVACVVVDHTGRPTAAVGVTVDWTRADDSVMSQLATASADAAATLTARLTGRPTPTASTGSPHLADSHRTDPHRADTHRADLHRTDPHRADDNP